LAGIINNDAWTYKLIFDYADEEHTGTVRARYIFEEIDQVPEPLAWGILEDLIKAVLVMFQGAVESQQEGWKEIVHRGKSYSSIQFYTE
jgi:hypothetical protein